MTFTDIVFQINFVGFPLPNPQVHNSGHVPVKSTIETSDFTSPLKRAK